MHTLNQYGNTRHLAALTVIGLVLAPLGCTLDVDGQAMEAGTGGLGDGRDDGADETGVGDEDGGGDQGSGSGDDGGGDDGGGDDGGGDGEAGDDGGEGDDDGDGEAGDGGSGIAEHCAEVDMLFVIDNSSSMAVEQAKMQLELAEFVNDAFDVLADASVHVGVITTDSGEIGTGVSELLDCEFGGDGSGYFEHTGPADAELYARLACATEVGVGGEDSERPVASMLEALDPSDPPSMNEGFVREGAMLIVVLVTDEDDLNSAGSPSDWVAQIAELRDGLGNVAMLSLLGNDSIECSLLSDTDLLEELVDVEDIAETAQPGDRLEAMTQGFFYEQVGNICALDYDDFFTEATSTIAEACMP